MEQRARKINRSTYESQTFMQRNFVDSTVTLAMQLLVDQDKKARRNESLCLVCFYRKGRIGGAACTTVPCGICGKVLHFGNTCVDILCQDCAGSCGLCKHCGGDVNLVVRRNLKLEA